MTKIKFIKIQDRLGKQKKFTNIMLAGILGRTTRQISGYRTGEKEIPERVAWAMLFYGRLARTSPNTWEEFCKSLREHIKETPPPTHN